MFIAALCKIARTGKQPKCPSTEERIKKMGYMYTVGYYSTIKRNKTGSFVETRMDLESIIHVSKSEREKQVSYINAFKGNMKKMV